MSLTPIQTQQIKTFKALSDGTRLRMIGALHKPMTVKQLADSLGEDHHKLYHHMRVLEQAHIVKLVETRTDSHIVEKYYQLVKNAVVGQIGHTADEQIPIFNSIVMDMVQSTLTDLAIVSKRESERAHASRLYFNCRPDQMPTIKEVIGRHTRALVTELSEMEDLESRSAYELMLLHFPVMEAQSHAEMKKHGHAVALTESQPPATVITVPGPTPAPTPLVNVPHANGTGGNGVLTEPTSTTQH